MRFVGIEIRKDSIKSFVWAEVILVNFVTFTLYVIWLDSFINGINFSNSGLVFYIIIVALLVIGINKGGHHLEERDRKQDI